MSAPPEPPPPHRRRPHRAAAPATTASRRRLRSAPDPRGSDDVELEVADTGPSPAPLPLPPPPRTRARDDTGMRRSAAAALLEQLRTSGTGARRRYRNEPPPSAVASEPEPVPMPSDVAPPVAAPIAPPPPTDLPPRRMVDVSWSGVRVSLPWRTGERAPSLALRAAFAMGGYPVDPLGRPLGGPRICADGAPLPPDAVIEPGAYELEVVAAEVRRVDVQVRTDPPLRFQTLVSTAIPIGWVVGGLVRLAALPPGEWAALEGDAPVDGDRLALEVLGGGAELVIGPAR
ncbi:MAG: hypothetical protein R3F59_01060 [Myxococcota bacterium]